MTTSAQPTLIFGKNGQLSGSIFKKLSGVNPAPIFLGQEQADFLQPDLVIEQLNQIKPKIVINCSAYTAVDLAESEKEKCLKINATTPARIAEWCGKNKATLIHFSTDYIFSGDSQRPWIENDSSAPKNWYGETKLRGERSIIELCPQHLIFRISWVYSEIGKNFVKTMIKLGAEKEELKVVSDQWGYPTYAQDVADILIDLVLPKIFANDSSLWGVYHLAGKGYTNWYLFSQRIFQLLEEKKMPLRVCRVLPIATSDYKTPALRPLNSRLESSKFQNVFGKILPDWESSLTVCLNRILNEGNS